MSKSIRRFPGIRREAGFTLIEVMIAILVLAVGLLGFALLQTMNVRFTQSANYRSQATNLAYEMLDQIRLNRVSGAQYVGSYPPADASCEPWVVGDGVTAVAYRDAWSCRVRAALGDNAAAEVRRNGDHYIVDISWNDERWTEDGFEPDFSVGADI